MNDSAIMPSSVIVVLMPTSGKTMLWMSKAVAKPTATLAIASAPDATLV